MMKKKTIASLLVFSVVLGMLPGALAAGNENVETVERILHTPQMIADGVVTYTEKNKYANWTTGTPFDGKTGDPYSDFCGNDDNKTFDPANPETVVEARLDFGDGNGETLSKIKYYPRTGQQNRLNGIFEGSNDGINWKTIHDTGTGGAEMVWYTVDAQNYAFFDAGNYTEIGIQSGESFDLKKSVWDRADAGEKFRYIRYASYWRTAGNDIGEIEYYAQKPVRQVTIDPVENGQVEMAFTYYGDSYSSMDGTVQMDLSKYAEGDYLTVTAQPEEGCYLKGLRVRKADGALEPVHMVSENTYSFQVPEQDVSIQADFVQGTLPPLENGAYQISTADQLEWFRDQVNNNQTAGLKINGVLLNDIDLQNEPWVPIGDCNENNKRIKGFQGSFDGQGHCIKNITLCVDPNMRYESTMEYTGFFGCIHESAVVKNLHLRNVMVPTFTTGSQHYPGVGGMAGRVSGKIYNCSVEHMNAQDITISKSSLSGVGGMAGCAQGSFYNSYVKDITISGATTYSGGFAGQLGWSSGLRADNCCAYGINASSSNGPAGAFAVIGEGNTVTNSYYGQDAVIKGENKNADTGVIPADMASGNVKDALNAVAAQNSDYIEWYQGSDGPVLRKADEAPQEGSIALRKDLMRSGKSYEAGGSQVFDQGFVAEYEGDLEGKSLGITLTQNGQTADLEFEYSGIAVEGGASVIFGFVVTQIPETLRDQISAQPYVK